MQEQPSTNINHASVLMLPWLQTLSDTCRSELTSVVHVALTRYRVGMPLTGVCDGDVMARWEQAMAMLLSEIGPSWSALPMTKACL